MTQTYQETSLLSHKQNAMDAAERLDRLWSRQYQDRICAHMNVPTETLNQFAETHVDGPTSYPDPHERIAFWDSHLREVRELEDDWLPIAYLSEFDQGIVGGALGEEMRFMMHKDVGWISSMCAPVMDDLADCDLLKIDSESSAIKLLDEQVRIFTDVAKCRFGVAPFIIIDCMNFVAEMRGMTQAFIDVIDNPEVVVCMMDFALEFNIFLQERVRRMTDGFMGGSFVNMGSWCKGNPILFSVDAYHMANPDFYYQWGVPHLQKILSHFGGGLLHVHSMVYPMKGESFAPELPEPEVGESTETAGNVGSLGGYFNELKYYLGCIKAGKRPDMVTPADAREAVRICVAARESVKSGKVVEL